MYFATDRFQAILVRARSAMKQRKENSNDTTRPNWHFRSFFFFFNATRLFPNLLVAHAFIAFIASCLSSWNEKWKAWHSFSLTKATSTLVCCLFLFFFSPHVRHVLKDPGYHYHLRFYITINTLQRGTQSDRIGFSSARKEFWTVSLYQKSQSFKDF